jgi:predicted nucleic acid-binding protein
VAEVTHRLMTVEAVAEGLVTPGNVVAKLRRRPDVVKRLRRYREQVEKIPLMGVRVAALDLRTLLMAGTLRPETGLLTNDSLAAATALEQEIDRIASADPDFEAVEGVTLHVPGDL